jgi:hypothetical protein
MQSPNPKAPGCCLKKRDLQHRNWRMNARFFNHVLGRFTVIDGWIYPYNRETTACVQSS